MAFWRLVLTVSLFAAHSLALPSYESPLLNTETQSQGFRLVENDRSEPRRSSHYDFTRKRDLDSHYIVLLDMSSATADSSDIGCPRVEDVLSRVSLSADRAEISSVYEGASTIRGFSGALTPQQVQVLQAMSETVVVEKTLPVQVSDVISEEGHPWGLQRISSSTPAEGYIFDLNYEYTFDGEDTSALGKGVDVYVIDTGFRATHAIFEGRAVNIWPGFGSVDDAGHGTHVGGTIGGAVFGVARGVNLFSMKALDKDGNGNTTSLVGAINEAIIQHQRRAGDPALNGTFKASVINISIGAFLSAAQDTAVRAAVTAGMHVVVSAGNDHQDACETSPAGSGGIYGPAITVGAVRIDDNRASFSNYGTCVDVYAPGAGVISSYFTGDYDVTYLSGTSQAAPHVTGLVAYWAAKNETLAKNPSLMKLFIAATGTQLILTAGNATGLDGSERLVNNRQLVAWPA